MPNSPLDWLTDAFVQFYPADLPLPSLSPVQDGKVQAEWSFDRYDVELDIDPVSRRAECFVLDMQTMETTYDRRFKLDLSNENDWNKLKSNLRRIQYQKRKHDNNNREEEEKYVS